MERTDEHDNNADRADDTDGFDFAYPPPQSRRKGLPYQFRERVLGAFDSAAVEAKVWSLRLSAAFHPVMSLF